MAAPSAPVFRSPFTDLTGSIMSHQWRGPCQKFEMDLVDCMEAYGLTRSAVKCQDLFKDFKECASREKQDARILAMMFERERQIWSGKLPKAERYAEPPQLDSY